MTSGDRTDRLGISIALRVGIPMAAAMWVLAELAGGLAVSEMAWWAILLASGLVFVAFNQAITIADDHLNDLPEDVVA